MPLLPTDFFHGSTPVMPQLQFPFFPAGMTLINSNLGFKKDDGKIFYFHGSMPVFSHDENDYDTFRLFTSQLYLNGNGSRGTWHLLVGEALASGDPKAIRE